MKEIIKPGFQAPVFELKDQSGVPISLNCYLGKKVLLSWHPLAWTSVCTDQMRSLDRNFEAFMSKNTIPLGLSVDPEPSKAVWAKAICLKRLRILSDFNPLGETAQNYGIFSEEHGASKRANILINESGEVIWSKKYEIKTLPDIDEVLALL